MPRRTSPIVVPKRATNVSIRSDLLSAAREAGVNLSAALERALTEELAASQGKKWREENREAIRAYNDHVEKSGIFADDVRSF
ncbi:MAG: type II toxin-antitoxin system CcdA family antitoxin [Steroidobacteraceae bacterium]